MQKEQRTCKSEGCGRSIKGRGYYCKHCYNKRYKEKNPERYAYRNLKSNAKSRGKEFTITFDYFKQFCFETEYIKNKGKTSKSYSIDRIKDELGYVPGNIRILELGQNTAKNNVIRKRLDGQLARDEGIFKVITVGEKKKGDDEVVPF